MGGLPLHPPSPRYCRQPWTFTDTPTPALMTPPNKLSPHEPGFHLSVLMTLPRQDKANSWIVGGSQAKLQEREILLSILCYECRFFNHRWRSVLMFFINHQQCFISDSHTHTHTHSAPPSPQKVDTTLWTNITHNPPLSVTYTHSLIFHIFTDWTKTINIKADRSNSPKYDINDVK